MSERITSIQGLAEVDLKTGERRSLDDEPFRDEAQDVLRIATGSPHNVEAVRALGLREDSQATLLLPDVNLDSSSVFEVKFRVFMGSRPVVLVATSEPLPRETLDDLIEMIISNLHEPILERSPGSLAGHIDYMGLWVVNQRTRRIENSVRTALDDEQSTADELEALRKYPERLARVEQVARRLRADPPQVDLPGQRNDFKSIVPQPVGTRFGDHIKEAERDARDAVARLSGLISSQQIVLSQRQAREAARFQRLIRIIGAAVLVPGLVAAIFGANVGFPERESSDAFLAMLLLMAGSGIASYALLRSFETPTWRTLEGHRPFVWLMSLPTLARIAIWAALALIALGLGVLTLLHSESPR